MYGYLTLPGFYRSQDRDMFLWINERGELVLDLGTGSKENSEIVLVKGCRRFFAVPDREAALHIAALNGKRDLIHIQVKDREIREFPVTDGIKPGYFVMAFDFSGKGLVIFNDDKNENQLFGGHFNGKGRWEISKQDFPEEKPLPVYLSSEKSGLYHLMIYDRSNGRITYYCRPQTLDKWTEPFILADSVNLPIPPSLWIDNEKTIHTAFYNPNDQSICYRKKTAGGWPRGGWQPEYHLPVDTPPTLLSFFQEGGQVRLWYVGTGTDVQVFSWETGIWNPAGADRGLNQPVRQVTFGQQMINLTDMVPGNRWLFAPLEEARKLPSTETVEEERSQNEEELLVIYARKMTEEKRLLERRLSKQEIMLNQYRQMLENSRESYQKQRLEWNERFRELRGKNNTLEEMLRSREEEIQKLQQSLDSVKSQLAALEAERRKEKAEMSALRDKLLRLRQNEVKLLSAIETLEDRLQGKRGMWDTLSSLFQKKP